MGVLIFLDLEWNTTFCRDRAGERVPFHELLEIAAMKVEKGTGAMLDSFHSYICPTASRRIESRTYRLLPYEREELRTLLSDAPRFLDLGPAFLRWCGPDPVFVEWGNNDVEVLLSNFSFHRLSFDEDWKFEYFDLQYMYQKLIEGNIGCQPSLEKAVTELGIETDLDFHSAWNDTYYTVLAYQAMLDRIEGLTMFHRPPKHQDMTPIREMDLGVYETRWSCKNRPEIDRPVCPLCGGALEKGRWVRTTPTEQVTRCRCEEHGRMYVVVTAEKDGGQWKGKGAIYRRLGPIGERYQAAMRSIHNGRRRKRRRGPEQAVG